MHFIELTSKENGEPISINLDYVSRFEKNGNGTSVIFDSKKVLEVKESLQTINSILERNNEVVC